MEQTTFTAPTSKNCFITKSKVKETVKELRDVEGVQTEVEVEIEKEVEIQETKIEHTYENGKKVVFLLLSSGKVAVIREGKGSDVEAAAMQSEGNKGAYLTAMTAACVKVDGKQVNMFELKEESMKDFLAIQGAFAELNF